MSYTPATSFQSINLTIDDFDAIFRYSDDAVFNTNDPSQKQEAFEVYLDATAHWTTNTSAYVNLTFVGTDIALYGASGPAYGSYSVDLDGQVTNATAYAARNVSLPHLLYSSSGLNVSQEHHLVLRNLGNNGNSTQGSQMLLDYAKLTVPIAPQGATLTNTTVEDNNDKLVYTGLWDSNTDPVLFSGGTTTYTNESGASVSLTFSGSAIYVYGDQNNDHFAFNVTLDGVTTSHQNPFGCSGPFEPGACEKRLPGVKFFAGPLNSSEHTITVSNYVVPSLNFSYFDLDRFVYTTPSEYLTLPGIPSQNAAKNSANDQAAPSDGSTGGSTKTRAVGIASLMMVFLPFIFARV